jgi:hypothetical protein
MWRVQESGVDDGTDAEDEADAMRAEDCGSRAIARSTLVPPG